MISPL